MCVGMRVLITGRVIGCSSRGLGGGWGHRVSVGLWNGKRGWDGGGRLAWCRRLGMVERRTVT